MRPMLLFWKENLPVQPSPARCCLRASRGPLTHHPPHPPPQPPPDLFSNATLRAHHRRRDPSRGTGGIQRPRADPRTKMAAGDLIARLSRRRGFLSPTGYFDATAGAHGIAALRAADVTPATAEAAVDEVLTILGKLIHDNLN